MGRFIPLSIPNFEGNEEKYVADAVAQGWVSTGGAYITQLEERLQEYLHTEKVAACQSGTAALHLALVACGVQPGDMVLVPTLTFIAAVNPVRYQFAEPVFMDCDESLCMDPGKLRQFCEEECVRKEDGLYHRESGKHIRAVVVVHVFGNLADMEQIMDIAQTYGLRVIEDATEALGSRYEAGRYAGRYAGTIGDFGAYSFNGNKIITTGGGGALTGKNAGEVEHLKYLSTQAKDDPHYYIHNEIGYNYRMTNLQAALGVAQMEELEEFIRRKRENYTLYEKQFDGFAYGTLLGFRPDTRSNQWFYSLQLPTGDDRRGRIVLRDLITALVKEGIQTRPIWGLIHEQKPYQGFRAYRMEQAPMYGSCILNIPCSTQITEEEIIRASEVIRQTVTRFMESDRTAEEK